MPTALTLADVFNAEAAEAPYQRLVAVLNRQETLLTRLGERLDALQASQETAARSTRELEEQTIAPLADRISALEGETKREREAIADACRAQIQALESALRLKCDRRALTDAIERSERATLKLGLEVDPCLSELMKAKVLTSVCYAGDSSGPRPRASSWSTACRWTRTCCTSVSGPSTGGSTARSTRWRATGLAARSAGERLRLTSHMQTEASRMDAALTQIREFRPVAAELATRVQALEEEQSELIQSVRAGSQQLEGHATELARLGESANSSRRHTAALEREVRDDVMPQLRGSVEVLTRLEEGVSKCETLADTLESALRTLSAKFHAHAASSADSARQISSNVKVGCRPQRCGYPTAFLRASHHRF
jgi:chromosome segregation ATPase